jgi:hypothetical protein
MNRVRVLKDEYALRYSEYLSPSPATRYVPTSGHYLDTVREPVMQRPIRTCKESDAIKMWNGKARL